MGGQPDDRTIGLLTGVFAEAVVADVWTDYADNLKYGLMKLEDARSKLKTSLDIMRTWLQTRDIWTAGSFKNDARNEINNYESKHAAYSKLRAKYTPAADKKEDDEMYDIWWSAYCNMKPI